MMLEIKNLSVKFPHQVAVKEVSFIIPKGETVALVGESGSGKSMTALAIMGILPLDAKVTDDSHILFNQEDLLDKSEVEMLPVRGGKIAIIFQEASSALNPVLTIHEQIEEVLKAHSQLRGKEAAKKILSLLLEVGIRDPEQCAKSYPHQLSGGMKQRAMIAMALAGEPALLIADEPTTALDVTIQAQVLTLLQKIQKNRQMSMLFITHDLAIVQQIANEVVVMRYGEVVEKATAENFFLTPQHPYSKELFAAMPDWNPRRSLPSEAKPIIQVNDLKVHYPIRKGLLKRTVGYIKAVDGISFNLTPGRTLALVGESGSGKTTAGHGILHLIPVTSGQVRFLDDDLNEKTNIQLKEFHQQVQIVFQDPYSSMNPRMRIFDIIAEGLKAQKLPATEKIIGDLLALVELDPASQHRYPHEFSGGQRQRICIARALAVKPKIIICDEPTSALDASVRSHMLDLLDRLQREFNLAYLIITHDIGVVARIADEMAVMSEGKIVEQGSVFDILSAPQHPYTQKLLSAVPKLKIKSEVVRD